MKPIRFLLVVIFALFLAVALSPAAPFPAAHATTHVPDGLTAEEWAQIQTQLAPQEIAAWTEQAKLTASDATAYDELGGSVAVSGETAVVGAPLDDDVTADSGSAYVFVRSGGTWSQQAKLTASDPASDDGFGHSVTLSGDTIVVGAPSDDDGGINSGSTYVFVRSGTSWSQQAKLTASDPAGDDWFGNSVTLSGDTAVVGAPLDDDVAADSGSAYVFVRSGTSWSQQAKLTASDAGGHWAYLGWSVALSGDTAVVGAIADDSAYVFVRSGGSWSQQVKLTASDAAASDWFGHSVAISGDTAIVGAYGDDDSGSAYVFVRSGASWSQQAKLTASDAATGDEFGWSVALSGDTAIIGAYLDDDGASKSGSAYVFGRSGGSWSEQAKLNASDPTTNAQFGYSVAVSGNTAIMGARRHYDSGYPSGSAYVFTTVEGFSISGQITDSNNNPLADVTISTNSGQTTTTNTNGSYTITGLITGTHTLTPSKAGYTFSPLSRTIAVPPSSSGQNFIGTPLPTGQTPIILLPGIMGSYLTNTPNWYCIRPFGQIWPGLQYLPIPSNNTSLYNASIQTLFLYKNGISPDNSCDNISATGVIETFLGVDYYGDFQTALTDAGYQVYPFDYDWRLDIEQIAQTLDARVNAILNETGATKVILIGHSLGGLVSRQYTLENSRADKVAQVITVGTPYWGAPETAYHMRKGTIPMAPLNYVLSNSNVRTLHRNSPAVMQILPSQAYVQQAGNYFMLNNGFLNYEETTTHFASNGQNEDLLELAEMLHAGTAEMLHAGTDDFRENLAVPYHVLTANHLSAVNMVREYNCWLGNTCWDETEYASGDGTVPWVSARLKGIVGDWSGDAKVCTFQTLRDRDRNHSTMMGDAYVISDTLRILEGQPTTYCLPSAQLDVLRAANIPQERIQIALWGEATIAVEDAFGNSASITAEGFAVNTIPASSYRPSQDTTFILLPAGQVYTLTIDQQSTQPVQLRITNFQADSIEDTLDPQMRALFMDVPAAVGGQASLLLDLTSGFESLQLHVDLDNNGTSDYILPPTSVLDETDMEDLTAPETMIQIDGQTDAWGFYTGLVTATLSATDGGTGVSATHYSLDGGQTWEVYTEPVAFMAEQVAVLEARSVDMAGNQEAPWPVLRLRPFGSYLPFVQR